VSIEMTKVGNHPHNKSHAVVHSQSHSHHSATKVFTHKSPALRTATAHQQQKLLAQQQRSKNSSVKTFQTPTSVDPPLVSLGGVGGALAGLIPSASSFSSSKAHSNNNSTVSLLDRYKASSTPTHLKRTIRENVVEKIQNVLQRNAGKLGVHLLVGFNSIQRVIECQPRHLSVLVLAKDTKDDLLRIIITSATQQRIPFVVLPSFSYMLKDACRLKKVFCLAVRSNLGIRQRTRLLTTTDDTKKSRKSRKDTCVTPTELPIVEPKEEEDFQLSSDLRGDPADGCCDLDDHKLQEEALEASLDDLRDYLLSLSEASSSGASTMLLS
jgi:hypothetical protein